MNTAAHNNCEPERRPATVRTEMNACNKLSHLVASRLIQYSFRLDLVTRARTRQLGKVTECYGM